jgi:hypothetical protein
VQGPWLEPPVNYRSPLVREGAPHEARNCQAKDNLKCDPEEVADTIGDKMNFELLFIRDCTLEVLSCISMVSNPWSL